MPKGGAGAGKGIRRRKAETHARTPHSTHDTRLTELVRGTGTRRRWAEGVARDERIFYCYNTFSVVLLCTADLVGSLES